MEYVNGAGFYIDALKFVESRVIPVTGAAIDNCTDKVLETGETCQLNATILPEDATDRSVSWSSSNETVATVNADGMVTAVSLGSATIEITTVD